jgi:acetyl esterase/lipase
MTTQELEGLVAKFRKLPPSDDMSLEQVRDGMRFFETALPAPDDARVDVIETNGVAAEWVRAPNVADDANNPGRVLLYLHGGGYTYCGPGTHRLLCRRQRECPACCLTIAWHQNTPSPLP